MDAKILDNKSLRDLASTFFQHSLRIAWCSAGIPTDNLRRLQEYARGLSQLAYRTEKREAVTHDLRVAAANPGGVLLESYAAGAVVPYSKLPNSDPFRQAYDDDSFFQLLRQSGCELPLFPYDLPFGAVNINFMRYGDQLNRHYDFSDITLVLILQTVPAGGEFTFLDESDRERRLHVADGSFVLMRGREVLHWVSRIESDGERISVTWATSHQPGVRSTTPIRLLRYGVSE